MCSSEHRVPGMIPCSKEERKAMWMRKRSIRLFMQMELKPYRDDSYWLIICYLCAVNDYPEEYCPPMYLLVPPQLPYNV